MKAPRAVLVALVAAVLVVVVGTTPAFGAVRDLFGGKSYVGRTTFFSSEGKRGSSTVRLVLYHASPITTEQRWRIGSETDTEAPTGQYVQVSGRGQVVRIGGHKQGWSAGLVGFVTRPGEAKQRVVITMKGRPKGVFVLTPLQPGVLKRDSGTLTYTHTTG